MMRAKTSSNYGSEAEPGSPDPDFFYRRPCPDGPEAGSRAASGRHPIGHLGDITLRALETLAGVDIIACEDTRITRRLTERYVISAQLKQYHEHNAARRGRRSWKSWRRARRSRWSRTPARR